MWCLFLYFLWMLCLFLVFFSVGSVECWRCFESVLSSDAVLKDCMTSQPSFSQVLLTYTRVEPTKFQLGPTDHSFDQAFWMTIWPELAPPHRYIVKSGLEPGAQAQPPNGTNRSGFPLHVWLAFRWDNIVQSHCQWQILLRLFLSHFLTWPGLSLLALHCQCHVLTWPVLSLSVLYFDPYFGILVGRTWWHGCVVHTFSTLQPSLIVPSIFGIYDRSPLVQSVVARVVFWAIEYDPWSVCT